MKFPIKKFKRVGPSLAFNDCNGICFNALRAIDLEIFGNIHTYTHTYII